MSLDQELARRLPDEAYLRRWFAHREHLWPWDASQAEETSRWAEKTARAVELWVKRQAAGESGPLDRQEDRLLAEVQSGTLTPKDASTFLTTLYPQRTQEWQAHGNHPRALVRAWTQERRERQTEIGRAHV